MFLKISQNSRENTEENTEKPEACNFIKKETLECCEFCEIFKNTFFTEHNQTTAPENLLLPVIIMFM